MQRVTLISLSFPIAPLYGVMHKHSLVLPSLLVASGMRSMCCGYGTPGCQI